MPFAVKRTMLVLGLFLLISTAISAETLTLDQCIERALKNHPNVISAKGNVKNANGELWNAFGDFLPSVSAGGQVYESTGPKYVDGVPIGGGKFTKNYGLDAGAQLTIFNGGQNFFNYFAARANKAYYKYAAEQTEQGLILTVKTYYFAYLAALKLKEIREEAVKYGEEQLKLANSKFEVGSASKSDVLKAKVQYGTDKLNLIDALNGIQKAHADLAYFIGLDVNSDVEFSSAFKSQEYDGTEADALKFGMANYPGLLAADKNMAGAKNNVRSAWGRFLPTITISYRRSYQDQYWHEIKTFPLVDRSTSLSTNINIPIFSNFSRTRALSSAKVSLNNARANYYYAKNNVALEIKKAFLDMTKAKEKLSVAGENEAAAMEDMSLVQEKYNLGAATILELLDAQVSLITAQNDKIQSEFDYNLAVATLENAMGVR